MALIVENFFWILMITGVLTALVGLGAIAPARGLAQTFGGTVEGPGALLIVRHWNFLVGVSGLLLIAAAYHPEWRTPILWFAVVSKSSFAALVLVQFRAFAGKPAVIAAVADVVMVALYLTYLVAA